MQTASDDPVAAPARPTTVSVEPATLRIEGPYTHANLQVFAVRAAHTAGDTVDTGDAPAPWVPEREVLTLAQALEQGKVRVYETGEVQELAIENLTGDSDVYVQSGDLVQGGKQDRVLAVDLLVSPGSGKVPLRSFCVESGRWEFRAADSLQSILQNVVPGTAGSAPFGFTHFSSSSKELKHAVRSSRDQQDVWSAVAETQTKLSSNLGTDVRAQASATSMELTLGNEKVQAAASEYEQVLGDRLRDDPDLIGFAFAVNGRLSSAELYAAPGLCHGMWKKMLRASAVEAIAELDAAGGAASAAVTPADVARFLAVPSGTKGQEQDIDARTRVVTVQEEARVFTETREGAAGVRWVHRSYLAR